MSSTDASMTPTPDETLTLLRNWQERHDREALGQILERNLSFVLKVVRARMGAELREDLQSVDMLQEVAVDALEYGPRFLVSSKAELRAILVRMVENNIRDRLRWRHRQKRDARRNRVLATSIDLSAPSTEPGQGMEEAELRELVRLAVEMLEHEDRRVVTLHQLEGRPMAEVAELLGLKPSTAHMRYQRAMPRLAEKVQQLLRNGVPPL